MAYPQEPPGSECTATRLSWEQILLEGYARNGQASDTCFQTHGGACFLDRGWLVGTDHHSGSAVFIVHCQIDEEHRRGHLLHQGPEGCVLSLRGLALLAVAEAGVWGEEHVSKSIVHDHSEQKMVGVSQVAARDRHGLPDRSSGVG